MTAANEEIEHKAGHALMEIEQEGASLTNAAYLVYLQKVRSLLDSSIQAAEQDFRRG